MTKLWNPYVKDIQTISETKLYSEYHQKLVFKPGSEPFFSRYSKSDYQNLYYWRQPDHLHEDSRAGPKQETFLRLRIRVHLTEKRPKALQEILV